MSVVDCSFSHPLKLEEKAVLPLAGGIMQHGYQCGMLWGATLAAGAQAYRLLGPGPQAETQAIIAAQSVVETFRACCNHIDCFEITEVEWKPSSKSRLVMQVGKFFIKGGPIGCFRLAARYAPVAFEAINTALSENHVESPSPPVSCAAMLAQKMGVSEMHTVMAAGLAGGIGLCGGGCGALGAAIWIIGMDSLKEENKIGFENPRAVETIDRFMKNTGYEFECSAIVGRRFEDINDHAGYLREGGCSELIELLAAECISTI